MRIFLSIISICVFLSGCNSSVLPPILSSTVYNPLKFYPAEEEVKDVAIIIRTKSDFMIDNRDEYIRTVGHLLQAGYDSDTGSVTVFLGHDNDVATVQGSIFSSIPVEQSREKRRQAMRRGGVACHLTNEVHEKLAIRMAYGTKLQVQGTVVNLIDGWVHLEDCTMVTDVEAQAAKNPTDLKFIQGRWCVLSTGFMNRNVKWKVDYRAQSETTFNANYIYADQFNTGWQNKGTENFARNDKDLTRTLLASNGVEEAGGVYVITDKESMTYYPKGKGDSENFMMLKCK